MSAPSSSVIAVLRTLAYADIFHYPLASQEVFTYLIGEEDIPPAAVDQTLLYLVREGLVERTGGFFFLAGRSHLVSLRHHREQICRTKWCKVRRWTYFFRFCPWIKMVGVSGALAMNNSEDHDDLDLVLVTAPKRLWLTRLLVVAFLLVTGQYRRPGKVDNRFCPNLFFSEDALSVFEQNLFIAHEIAQLRLLWERDGLYERFLSQNGWVRRFLPNALEKRVPTPMEERSKPLPFLTFLLDLLEEMLKKIQLKFMAGKRTKEIVTDKVLRFHPRETLRLVLTAYEQRTRDLGLP